MPAERPHRYYSSDEMLERIAELEAELLDALEREKALREFALRMERVTATCLKNLSEGKRPPYAGTELDPQRIHDLARAARFPFGEARQRGGGVRIWYFNIALALLAGFVWGYIAGVLQ